MGRFEVFGKMAGFLLYEFGNLKNRVTMLSQVTYSVVKSNPTELRQLYEQFKNVKQLQ